MLQHQNGGDNAETISTALIALLTSQPILAEQVPPLGHIPKIMQVHFLVIVTIDTVT